MASNSVQRQPVAPGRLWFGFLVATASWLALGFIDLMIVWQVCGYETTFGMSAAHHVARIVSFAVGVFLFFVAVTAGFTSYRNWRALSQEKNLMDARASERREFMAMLGVLMSIILGWGIVALAIPPLMIDYCVRIK